MVSLVGRMYVPLAQLLKQLRVHAVRACNRLSTLTSLASMVATWTSLALHAFAGKRRDQRLLFVSSLSVFLLIFFVILAAVMFSDSSSPQPSENSHILSPHAGNSPLHLNSSLQPLTVPPPTRRGYRYHKHPQRSSASAHRHSHRHGKKKHQQKGQHGLNVPVAASDLRHSSAFKTATSTTTIPTFPTFAILVSSDHSAAQVRATINSVRFLRPGSTEYVFHFSTHRVEEIAMLTKNYRLITSRRRYAYPLAAFSNPPDTMRSTSSQSNPSQGEQIPTLWLVAGTIISPFALQWLSGAYGAYAHRPDVAAFVLDTVSPVVRRNGSNDEPSSPSSYLYMNADDHDPDVWKVVDMKQLSSNSAFIYQSCPKISAIMLNTVNVSPHFRPWDTFLEWLQLRRGDWYNYPLGPGVDGTPFGKSMLPERNWTRAPWNVWLSKFLHEYELGVVYPNLADGQQQSSTLAANDQIKPSGAFAQLPVVPKKQVLVKSQRKGMHFDEDIVTLLGSGTRPKGGYFSNETIDKIINVARAQNGMISFTMVNKNFLDTAHSWLCNVDGGGFRPPGLVWAVTDSVAYKELKDVSGSTTVWLNEVQGGKQTGHEFGTPGYWKLMLERTALITELLSHGVGVFAFETDAVWLEDPFKYIQRLVDEDADIVGTINTRGEVSGNFFYLHPTLATRRVWREITREFEKAYRRTGLDHKKASSWTYVENDQSLLTKLVLHNDTWRARYPLNFITLDMDKFVDGRWYQPEKGFYSAPRARQPVVINNNFVIGVAEKTKRAKAHGHWFWDEAQSRCDLPAVSKAVKTNTYR